MLDKLTLRKRSQFFEFDDQSWLPQTLRRIYMQILGNNFFRLQPFRVRLLVDLFKHDLDAIYSLCSGDGQFIFALYRLLRKERTITFILSDLFPLPANYARIKALTGGEIDFVPTPVDATQIQPARGEWYLMAGSLHHLCENQVQAMFERITASEETLIMIENHDRSYSQALKLLVFLPIFSILSAIFGRLLRLENLLFGALLPIVPLMILADGLVSNFRSYRQDDLQSILESLPDPHGYSVKEFPVRYAVVLTGRVFRAREEVVLF